MFNFLTTTAKVDGVFLLDEGQLLALDDILQAQFKELKRRRNIRIAAEARRKMERYPSQYADEKAAREEVGKNYTFEEPKGYVEFEIKGVDTKFSSFRDAMTSGKFEGAVPREFDAYYSAGKDNVGVSLNYNPFSSAIKLNVTPPELFDGKALNELRRWAEEQQQPFYVTWWSSYAFLLTLILFTGMWILGSFVSSSSSSMQRRAMQEEAISLLKDGVTEKNRDKAIELILINQTGLVRSNAKQNYDSFYGTVVIVVACLLILVWLHPKTTVGIGKGKAALKRQKIWITFVVKYLFGVIVLGTFIVWSRNHIMGLLP